jgi:hypothetical protein
MLLMACTNVGSLLLEPLAREYGNGKTAVELPIEKFMVPLATMVRSRFISGPCRPPYD